MVLGRRATGLFPFQDLGARSRIFGGCDPAVVVRIRKPPKRICGRLGFVGLEKDVTVLVEIFESPVHEHPVALE